MTIYKVEYTATYYAEADTPDQAIDLATEQAAEAPGGDWEATATGSATEYEGNTLEQLLDNGNALTLAELVAEMKLEALAERGQAQPESWLDGYGVGLAQAAAWLEQWAAIKAAN